MTSKEFFDYLAEHKCCLETNAVIKNSNSAVYINMGEEEALFEVEHIDNTTYRLVFSGANIIIKYDIDVTKLDYFDFYSNTLILLKYNNTKFHIGLPDLPFDCPELFDDNELFKIHLSHLLKKAGIDEEYIVKVEPIENIDYITRLNHDDVKELAISFNSKDPNNPLTYRLHEWKGELYLGVYHNSVYIDTLYKIETAKITYSTFMFKEKKE